MPRTKDDSNGHRTYAYGRVSTADQTTENQRLEIEAAGYKVKPRRWFADQGVSGKVPAAQRPAFAKLLERLEPGDSLVVARLDRLGRDVIDVEATLERLEAAQVSVIVLQLGDVDLTSTAGKLIRRILGAVASMERDLLIERTLAGLARAKAEGTVLGRPSKTTAQQQAEMRVQAAGGGVTVSELARTYRISRATVRNVLEASQPQSR